jgi:hypothetical protein
MVVNRDSIPLEPKYKYLFDSDLTFSDKDGVKKEGEESTIIYPLLLEKFSKVVVTYPILLKYKDLFINRSGEFIKVSSDLEDTSNYQPEFGDDELIDLISSLNNSILMFNEFDILINGQLIRYRFREDVPNKVLIRVSKLNKEGSYKQHEGEARRLSSILTGKLQYENLVKQNEELNFPAYEKVYDSLNRSFQNALETDMSDEMKEKMKILLEKPNYADFMQSISNEEVFNETKNLVFEKFNNWFSKNLEETKDYINTDLDKVTRFYVNSFIIQMSRTAAERLDKFKKYGYY